MPRPTRLAYRWVGSIAGWQASPLGDVTRHDYIPDASDLDDDDRVQDQDLYINPTSWQEQRELVPLADQAAVDEQADEWAVLWQECADYECPDFNGYAEQLEILPP